MVHVRQRVASSKVPVPMHSHVLMSIIVIEGCTKQAGFMFPQITDVLIVSNSPSYETILSVAE